MQYRIKFQHITNPAKVLEIAQSVEGIPADKVKAVTICVIEDSQRRTVGLGYGFCSVRDTYSKEKGRRVALADALDDAFPYITANDPDAVRVNYLLRQQRAAIWNTYFSRNEGRFDPRKA